MEPTVFRQIEAIQREYDQAIADGNIAVSIRIAAANPDVIQLPVGGMFAEERVQIARGRCPHCAKPIDPTTLDNAEDCAEYQRSGLCPDCRVQLFASDPPGEAGEDGP